MYKLIATFFLLLITSLAIAQKGVSINSHWIIAHYFKKDSIHYPLEKNCYFTIIDSTFEGKAGCRDFSEKILIKAEQLRISSIKSNNLFCKKNSSSALFMAYLLKANKYSINAAELTLYYFNTKLMVLESWR
jgi:heat shock protein HslJ